MSSGVFAAPDLDAYLERLGYGGGLDTDAATLELLQLMHATRIPFENLDVQMGRIPALDVASLEAKLVRRRRGGYCFEQNALFAAVLEKIGFRVTRLLARVRFGLPAGAAVPRTHMVLRVEADGRPYLADVGFGSWGLLQPIPLEADLAVAQFVWGYRLRRDPANGWWVLQAFRNGAWGDLYAFSEEPQEPVDYEPANLWTATHPQSRFVLNLTVQLPGPEKRIGFRNGEFITFTPDGERSEPVADLAEFRELARHKFGIEVPADATFRAWPPR